MLIQNLKDFRDKLDLSQQEIADALGIKRETYANYEKRTIPPHSVIYRLSQIYNVSPSVFYRPEPLENSNILLHYKDDGLYGESSFLDLSSYEKVMVMKLRQLNKEDKIKIESEVDEILNDKK
ncbi:MAG: helix-turn-helix transcriptional regulator [Eubacterium sp.]|nr:helix-turn-helix transcriptional regulator [Eubacterium sp.]